jgi:hypothetical protein
MEVVHMSFQETADHRLEVIDTRDYSQFAEKYGPSLKSELCNWILLIIAGSRGYKTFDRLLYLAYFIFNGRSKPQPWDVSQLEIQFQDYIYFFNVFVSIGAVSEAEPLFEELYETLNSMAMTGHLDFQSPESKSIMNKARDLIAELMKIEKFADNFAEFLNGAF